MADVGNAVQALGLIKFKNLGNMTSTEIDRLFTILGALQEGRATSAPSGRRSTSRST